MSNEDDNRIQISIPLQFFTAGLVALAGAGGVIKASDIDRRMEKTQRDIGTIMTSNTTTDTRLSSIEATLKNNTSGVGELRKEVAALKQDNADLRSDLRQLQKRHRMR